MLRATCAAMLIALSSSAARAEDPAWAADLTALLGKHVDERGRVDYRAWKAHDEPALRAVVAAIASDDPTGRPLAEREAYWIDAYNALTLQAVLELYPLASIKDKAPERGWSVWRDYLLPAPPGPRRLSLDRIEHEVLRPLGDPRIHAAINCASLGCPPLRREAYVASRLDAQLDAQVRAWLSSPVGVRVGADGQVAASELFAWFGADFAPDEAGRLRWIAARVEDPRVRAALQRPGARLRSLPWDWALNEQ